jgi:hypothetical protein
VENYDRISREDPWAAISLVNELRQFKIHVGNLHRMRLLRYDSTDVGDFFDAALEFMRGNSESVTKSKRNSDRWERKREDARERKELLTTLLPAWIERIGAKQVWRSGRTLKEGGTLVPIPERAAVARVLKQLEAKQKARLEERATLLRKEAKPTEESWSDAQSLIDVLEEGGEDVRIRLRTALRRIIDSIWILVSFRGHTRIATVQVHFKDSEEVRVYSILHKPPRFNGRVRTPGAWIAMSGTGEGLSHDLRKYAEDKSVRKWHDNNAVAQIDAGHAIIAKDREMRELKGTKYEPKVPLEDVGEHHRFVFLP